MLTFASNPPNKTESRYLRESVEPKIAFGRNQSTFQPFRVYGVEKGEIMFSPGYHFIKSSDCKNGKAIN